MKDLLLPSTDTHKDENPHTAGLDETDIPSDETKLNAAIRHLHRRHNEPCLPPKTILQNLCFSFLLGIKVVPREFERKAHAKFWGADKVS